MKITGYKTLVFDCDGVVLDSNKVKTQAFYNAALPYGSVAADELQRFHTTNGGISRYKKFEYLLSEVVANDAVGPDLGSLLNAYATEVRQGLLKCKVADGLAELREMTCNSRWLIVSGGDQSELREVFESRGLSELFDGGIYGSPDNKEEILQREIARRNIVRPALFLGDSRYDHVAATLTGIDFLFIRGWSEFKGHADYCAEHRLPVIDALKDLLGGDARELNG